MGIKITKIGSAEIKFGYGATAAEIKEFFDSVPANAKISVDHWKGDQRDPEQTTIKATWEIH